MDRKIIEKTIENLQKNNMQGYYCESSEEARELVKHLIKKGETISSGGSQTLKETGIMDILKSGDYNYLDRAVEGFTREDVERVYRETYSCDTYFASSNAVTESGYLYNVDGNSNRVSAILYGPKSVILVCGVNKIVKDLDEAINRVKTKAAPPNTVRLSCNTYCEEKGHCMSLDGECNEFADGCKSEGRICCNFVVCAQQRHKDRIKVIFVNEELGY